MAISRQKEDLDSLNYRTILRVATGKPLNYLRAGISEMLVTKSEKSLKCSVVEQMEGNTKKPSHMAQSASQVTSNRGEKWRHRPKRQMWITNESQGKQEKLTSVMVRLSRVKDKEDTVPFQSPRPVAFKGATTWLAAKAMEVPEHGGVVFKETKEKRLAQCLSWWKRPSEMKTFSGESKSLHL